MPKYVKTKQDAQMEQRDLQSNPVMKYLRNQEALKFKVGDILIKQSKWGDKWKTDSTAIGTPKKFMYVFENEMGIGYIKQIKVDGSGFTNYLQCVVNFDGEWNRLVLDPDYVDHMLIGEEGEEFETSTAHLNKKLERKQNMAKNRKLCLKMKEKEEWFFHKAKVGDTFWYGHTFKDLVKREYRIAAVTKNQDGQVHQLHILMVGENYARPWDFNTFRYGKLSLTKPFPLDDGI